MIYEKETISYQKIKFVLKFKEQIDRDITRKINGGQAKGLVVKGRTDKREQSICLYLDLNPNIEIWSAIIVIK